MKSKNQLIFIAIVLMIFGCSYKVSNSKEKFKFNSSRKETNKIESIQKDSILNGWTDEGSFWLLRFEPKKVIFEFNPSCEYWFPSRIENNEIIFYWAKNMNCIFDRGLSKTFKNVETPELGKPFGKVNLMNDSILNITYFYKGWVKKINKSESESIDTLFPTRFKRIKL